MTRGQFTKIYITQPVGGKRSSRSDSFYSFALADDLQRECSRFYRVRHPHTHTQISLDSDTGTNSPCTKILARIGWKRGKDLRSWNVARVFVFRVYSVLDSSFDRWRSIRFDPCPLRVGFLSVYRNTPTSIDRRKLAIRIERVFARCRETCAATSSASPWRPPPVSSGTSRSIARTPRKVCLAPALRPRRSLVTSLLEIYATSWGTGQTRCRRRWRPSRYTSGCSGRSIVRGSRVRRLKIRGKHVVILGNLVIYNS